MASHLKIVALIPARGGSKSIPLKNIKLLAGRPLIYWALDAATQCAKIDAVYVATDSPQIAATVDAYRHPKVRVFHRSEASATDNAATEEVLLEFAGQTYFDILTLIQPTSPLITTFDLDKALAVYETTAADSLLSVVAQKRFIWRQVEVGFAEPVNYKPSKRPRRQEFQGFLAENGTLYITSRGALLQSRTRISGKIATYEMPGSSYFELDEPEDWPIVENILSRRNRQQFVRRLKNQTIRLFATDVDGVLTDAGVYYSERGEALKKFNVRDGHGLSMLRQAGIEVALITGENSPAVAARVEKLTIRHLVTGCSNKGDALRDLCRNLNITLEQVAYIGDDLNDIDAVRIAGFSACPADALPEIRDLVDYVCMARGGEGCVREVSDLIIYENQIDSCQLKLELE